MAIINGVSIQSPRRDIAEAHKKAFKETAFLFMRKCQEIISNPRNWDGYQDTRDIVDTGQLRASAKMTFSNDSSASLEWLTQYAAAVHNGATIRYANGNTRVIPAREWTKIAEEEFDFPQTYTRLFNRYVNR